MRQIGWTLPRLWTAKPDSVGTTNDQAPAKLLLQMDSGFLFDVKNNYIEEISTIIQRAMQSVCELPLRVVARTGSKWSSLVPNK